ncbi:hypothetical protein [Aeromicrobium sp. UC242_57]|uniref:ATP-dependent DNA ligase n=1 Tax=Aeromicrobium sp. UC242_57 TaxID=3374624 RepID=UPI003792639A
MDLPVMPPLKPMLAKSVKGVPAADSVDGGLSFEPKWDGFRCLVFRDGDEVVLASRSTRGAQPVLPRGRRSGAGADACSVRAGRRDLPRG